MNLARPLALFLLLCWPIGCGDAGGDGSGAAGDASDAVSADTPPDDLAGPEDQGALPDTPPPPADVQADAPVVPEDTPSALDAGDIPSPPGPCGSPKDCPDGQACNGVTGKCAACVIDEDCAGDEHCTAAGDCAPDEPCIKTVDCEPGLECLGGQCMPEKTTCEGAEDCPGPEVFCNVDQGVCVECVSSAQCGKAESCQDGLCVPHVCVPAMWGCTAGGLVFACGDDGMPASAPEACPTGPCGDGLCTVPGGCVLVPRAGLCDDGDPCTVDDACNEAGECQPGTAKACADDDPCTVDGCSESGECTHEKVEEGPCDDGDACTVGDECVEGLCAPGPAADCDDGVECTLDECTADGGCKHQASDASCDDSNPCTNDICDPVGGCKNTQSGEPGCCSTSADCDDKNDCTTDACMGGTCLSVPDASKPGCCATVEDCPKPNACQSPPRCVAAQCQAGGELDCDDSNPCTEDVCKPATGCQNTPAPGPCDDGDACTTDTQCSEGTCKGGQLLVCEDGNPCTADTCDPESGCSYAPKEGPCEDGDACTAGDQCVVGMCVSGSDAVDCDDDSACTVDSCVPEVGCVHLPSGEAGCCMASAECDDTNGCTTDACIATACVNVPDVAKPGCCGMPADCDDGVGCTKEVCESSQCSWIAADGPDCCVAEGDCDDSSACTVDSCLASNTCENLVVEGCCDSAVDCDDGDACTVDECDDGNACSHEYVANATTCPAVPAKDCSLMACTGQTVEAMRCAIGLCFGDETVLSAKVLSPTGDTIDGAWGAVGHYGAAANDLAPHEGASYAIISTGLYQSAGPGKASPQGGQQLKGAGQLADPFSPSGDKMQDAVAFELKLKVPAGATGLSVKTLFMSAEYEEWIGSSYNDKFYVILSDDETESVINYSVCSNPAKYSDFEKDGQKWCYIAINSAYSEPCSAPVTDISGTGYLCPTGSTTGWLLTTWPVNGLGTITLTFHIHDTSDESYDSLAIIDDFQWLTGPVEAVTVPTPPAGP